MLHVQQTTFDREFDRILTDVQTMAEKVEQAISVFNFIKIEPQHIIMREYYADFSMPKYSWQQQ